MRLIGTQTIRKVLIIMTFFWGLSLLVACQEKELKAVVSPEVVVTKPSSLEAIGTLNVTENTSPTISVTEIIPATTPFPLGDNLKGKIIFNYGFITNEFESRILDMGDFKEQSVQVPYSKYDMVPYGEGFSVRPGYSDTREYKPSFANYSPSNNGRYIAFPCGRSEVVDVEFEQKIVILICVWDIHDLSYSKEVTPHIIEEYNISNAIGSSHIFIGDISWSSDDNELFFTTHPSRYPTYGYPGPVEKTCLINRPAQTVNCKAVNTFVAEHLKGNEQSPSDIRVISWSPFDSKRFVLRNLSNLYVLETEEKRLSAIWKVEDAFFQPDGKLLWYNNGTKIAFVIDNEKNNNTVLSVDLSTKEVSHLFDYQEVFSKIAGVIPFGYHWKSTQMYISAFSPTEEYLLFEVAIGFDSNLPPLLAQNDYALGLFLYELKTGRIYGVRDFITTQGGDWRIHLNPDWIHKDD